MFTWRRGSRVAPQLSARKIKPRFNFFNLHFRVNSLFHDLQASFCLAWACDPIGNQYMVSGQLQKKELTTKSSQLEPAIWSRDTGQRIPCFDRCQLTMTWMSNFKGVRCKLGGQLEYGHHVGPLSWASFLLNYNLCVNENAQTTRR